MIYLKDGNFYMQGRKKRLTQREVLREVEKLEETNKGLENGINAVGDENYKFRHAPLFHRILYAIRGV